MDEGAGKAGRAGRFGKFFLWMKGAGKEGRAGRFGKLVFSSRFSSRSHRLTCPKTHVATITLLS